MSLPRSHPTAFSQFGLPDSWDVGYAYSGRNGGNPTGGFHLIVGADFKAGRIRRKKGDALCGKSFYNLDGGRKNSVNVQVTCKRCIALANSVTKYQLEQS